MQLTSLLVLFSAALANTKLQLSAQDMTLWSQLSASVAEINDKDCSGEIAFSFQQAQAVYERYGLSDQFLESLKYVSLVSGDIDEAAGFRNQWTNATVLFGHHYSLLKNSTAQVILDKYPAAPKATQAAGYKDGAYGAQAVTDEKHALYGVMSNAFTYSASAASAVAAAACLLF
ncbi:hypothetical protein BC833DRAFT_406279 [Globomyces pollinis-pini]|nr:hypothetical protein BC833DRAFT_406279 [Globomyces pollinis-pini]